MSGATYRKVVTGDTNFRPLGHGPRGSGRRILSPQTPQPKVKRVHGERMRRGSSSGSPMRFVSPNFVRIGIHRQVTDAQRSGAPGPPQKDLAGVVTGVAGAGSARGISAAGGQQQE